MTSEQTTEFLAWLQERETAKLQERDALVFALMTAEDALTVARAALDAWDGQHEE